MLRQWRRAGREQHCANRKGVPENHVNFHLLRKVVAKLTPEQQNTVALNIVGGYQPEAVHRLLERKATQIRLQHERAVKAKGKTSMALPATH